MNIFKIEGSKVLLGSIRPQGSKNEDLFAKRTSIIYNITQTNSGYMDMANKRFISIGAKIEKVEL